MSGDKLVTHGVVVEAFRGDHYAVDVELGGRTMRALVKRSGRLVKNRIRILAGDSVEVELSAFDPTKGRILYRDREPRMNDR